MHCERFEPGPSRHVARTNAPPFPPIPRRRARQERPRLSMPYWQAPAGTSCAGLLPLTLYGAGS